MDERYNDISIKGQPELVEGYRPKEVSTSLSAVRQAQPDETVICNNFLMTPKPGKSKYFIALVPPSPVNEHAQQWKEYFKAEFNSKAALNSPPHITLHMPFEWKTEKESKLIKQLEVFVATQKPFELELRDFGCFEPRVIFITVVHNPELMELQIALTRFCKTELNLFNATRIDQPYHPHLTVAFRDLKKTDFPKAWMFVRDLKFQARFTCQDVVLLKRSGRIWHVAKTFRLGISL